MPALAAADGKKRSRSRSDIDFRHPKEVQVKSILPHYPVNQQFAESEKKKRRRKRKKKKPKGDDDVCSLRIGEANEQQPITINNFPDDILILILSLLKSTREACRTTILSKRWENLWTQLPSHDFFVTGSNKQFMFRYLALAPTNIINLSLQTNEHIPWIPAWAGSIAEHHHVENLILKDCKGCMYVLPEPFYSQPTLRSLRIGGGILLPQGTVNWRALVFLKVSNIKYEGICKIGDILLGCPALECLMLRWVFINMLSRPVLISHRKLKILSVRDVYYYSRKNREAEVHVSTPQLEKLEIFGKWCCVSCKIIEDLPMLEESHLDFSLLCPKKLDPLYVAQKQRNNLKNLLEKIRYSKKLSLGGDCKKVYDDMNQESQL